jgi:hypothetical protein
MSRPGYAGRTALSTAYTASATAKRATAELRVPTHDSKERQREAMLGRAAVTTDTGA